MNTLRFLVIGRTNEFLDRIRELIGDRQVAAEYTSHVVDGCNRARNGGYDVVVYDAGVDYHESSCFITDVLASNVVQYVLAVTDGNHDAIAGTAATESLTCIAQPLDINEFQQVFDHILKVTRLKREVSEKDQRVAQLEVVNQIARMTLSSYDEERMLRDLAGLIHQRLEYFNVNIFLVDEEQSRIVLKAFAGGFGDDLAEGYSLAFGEGICGWVAQNRESAVTGDVHTDPRRKQGFAFEDRVQSELAVPIISGDHVYGVVHIESEQKNAFTRQDGLVLETVADQISLAFENMRLSRELLESKQLTETINDSLPVSILVLDRHFAIEYANQTFCEINHVNCEEITGQQLEKVFSEELLDTFDLANELGKVIEYGISISHSNIRHSSPHHPERILNVTFRHLKVGRHSRIMVLIQDVTEFTQKTYQLLLLREISLTMQGVQDRDRLLHLILTCVTAGFALGFNRAFLFLVDSSRQHLHGIMGVGPSSPDEAYRVWNELSQQHHTFQDYLDQSDRGDVGYGPLQDQISGISFDLAVSHNILTETVATGNYIHVLNAWDDPRVDEKLKTLLASQEFVAIPLIARNLVIGVLVADNAFSGRNISLDSIEVLTMLGSSAAMAIENASMLEQLEEKISELERTNTALKKTQDMLIRKEKLAAIGEVSARLAHEIRNPLATIGGFARSIPRRYEDRERTIRNANIIVDEVKRLEHILSNVLDYSKPSIPKKSLTDVGGLVMETLTVLEAALSEAGVIVVTDLPPEPMEVELDTGQIKQVLINVIQNALNAMVEGGALEVRVTGLPEGAMINITDTGPGIPGEMVDNIFEPFFTTRTDGTGLGLSISQMIVQNHGGRISIESRRNEGTSVSIMLPTC